MKVVMSLAILLFVNAMNPPRAVVLDWRCGTTVLHPTNPKPLNLSLFAVAGGGTLADRKAEFMDAVRDRVQHILGDAGVAVRVENAPSDIEVETTVRLSQEVSPTGKQEIGRAHYDPKNKHHGDEAIIFGEQIRRLGNTRPFGEWVTVFANVCSHETLHTLGYNHVSRDKYTPDGSNIELMLDGHTIEEMCREQRILNRQIDNG